MEIQESVLLRRVGRMDPVSVPEFEALGGFSGIRKALSMEKEEILEEISRSNLKGRGGAGYPAGRKWKSLYRIEGDTKYIVCNADEGEPGTFKDRVLLEETPLSVIEGMLIAGYVFGSKQGYIYIRGEYRRIQKIFETALQNAEDAGYLGKDILGVPGFDYSITVVSGGGAYVCGENSAMLNSIEGKTGRPRIKPPHLAEVGLYGKPTLVNNVGIARGDMGIEVPFEMVPVYQKMIITKVNAAGKIVVTATNMLETMTEKPRATRSEVSDVFNAVIDGTDATMLSGESANGKYPVESVRTMATINKNAQTLLKEYGRLDSSIFDRSSKTEVVASAVKDATNSMNIKLIVALTESGNTARLISKYRPEADILAITFDELTQKSLMLNWGVIPVVTETPSSTDDMFEVAERVALESGLVESGDNIVIVAGIPVGSGNTNTMRIRTVK